MTRRILPVMAFILAAAPALAQTNTGTTPGGTTGTTSGPAAGSPTTLGTGGTTGTEQNERDVLKNKGGKSVQRARHGQKGGTNPSSGDANAESGSAPQTNGH